MRYTFVISFILTIFNHSESEEFDVIPKVILIEKSRRVMGSLMLPEGSPWCNGNPMFWFMGHLKPESYLCENSPGVFERIIPNFKSADRHGCTAFDVNNDGLIDIMCAIGGAKGTATDGYNEVFLTQNDGSIKQIYGHGLESGTRRSKDFIAFKSRNGDDLILETVRASSRADGLINNNKMYKRVPETNGKFFEEMKGPWDNQMFYPLTVVTGLFDKDNALDIFTFGEELSDNSSTIKLYRQMGPGKFLEFPLADRWKTKYDFSAATAEDLNGDGLHDLIFFDKASKTFYIMWNRTKKRKIKFFRRKLNLFRKGKYTMSHHVRGIRALDVNGDGLIDIYVSQSRDEINEYCHTSVKGAYPAVMKTYGIDRTDTFSFEPPIDPIPDILFIQNAKRGRFPTFTPHELPLDLHGCAGKELVPFGEQKLAVAYSYLQWPGNLYLLDWSIDS